MSEEQIMKMLNCFPQIEVVKYILNLQEENAGLRTILKGTTHCYDEEEHQRLNNVLTEFEKWLEEQINNINKSLELHLEENSKISLLSTKSILEKALDKLQELKEGKNNGS